MKSILITCLISFLLLTTLTAKEWEVLNEGTGITKAYDFINKDTGWIAGDRGIIKTYDGGETWDLIFNGERPFVAIDFITDSIGWAIEGILAPWNPPYDILKTTNGGESWFVQKKVNVGDPWGEIDLAVISENVVYACIGESILKTNDAGSSWENITPPSVSDFQSCSFYNEKTGVVIGKKNQDSNNIIFRTIDGGITWDALKIPISNIDNVQFLNDSTCYFLNRFEAKIYKTNDFFNSWWVLFESDHQIKFYHFYDSTTAITLVNTGRGLESEFMKSNDGGLTWNSTEHILLKGGEGSDFNEFITPEATYIFNHMGGGLMSRLLKSIDQGKTWTTKKMMFPINDVHFINQETGFIAGGYSLIHDAWGVVFDTQDEGLTWDFLFPTVSKPTDFYFLNKAKAFLKCEGAGGMGPSNAIYTTIDGGYSWTKDTTIWESDFIFFLNDSVGWYKTYMSIFKTINGGHSWNRFLNLQDIYSDFSGVDYDAGHINTLLFINEETGYFVGDGGGIIKFSGEKEELRKIESGTTLPLNKIEFIDNEVGWIAGGYRNDEGFGSVFLRTADGGENWTKITGIDYLFHDFYFKDILQGWAVGEDRTGHGMVLGTIDGGENWTVQIDALSAPLNAIHFKDGFAWAVGDNGLILRMVDTTSTSAGAEIANNTSSFQIQNYPNPFHSNTIIRYQLPKSSEVEITIYDLFGRKITTLLKEQQAPGKYQQNWNAETMQPDIYICELKAGQNRQVLKVILMK